MSHLQRQSCTSFYSPQAGLLHSVSATSHLSQEMLARLLEMDAIMNGVCGDQLCRWQHYCDTPSLPLQRQKESHHRSNRMAKRVCELSTSPKFSLCVQPSMLLEISKSAKCNPYSQSCWGTAEFSCFCRRSCISTNRKSISFQWEWSASMKTLKGIGTLQNWSE